MATDRTPPNKRIKRAENSATEWKMKSIERREENERQNLKIKKLESKIKKNAELVSIISKQNEELTALKIELQKAKQKISNQKIKIEEIKKKARL